jgi:hypothetical protein
MSQKFTFGSGDLYAIDSASANPTPVRFGTLQNVSIDFASSVKELFGTFQMPVAAARGTMKVSGKAQYANLQGDVIAGLFFGVSKTAGQRKVAYEEAATIPATPFQVTVTHGADFVKNLGVVSAVTGDPLVRVAASPATGEYSVNETTGVYTFASADEGDAVKITYEFDDATAGNVISIDNQLLGFTPSFQIVLRGGFDGKETVFTLNKCVATKWNFATKLEDFVVQDFEFSSFADDSGKIGEISIPSEY